MTEAPTTIRDELLNVKVSRAEMDLIDRMAEYYGITRSEIVRRVIALYAESFNWEMPERLKDEAST
jgi:hypothetical protein